MFSASRAGAALALLGLAGLAHSACAQTTQDYGTADITPYFQPVETFIVNTNDNSPTFDRPAIVSGGITSPPTGLSGLGSAVAYGTHSFTASSDDIYRVSTATSGYAPGNFVQLIYVPDTFGGTKTFDPKNPLNNVGLAYNPSGTSGSYDVNLAGGTAYDFVNTGYYNADSTDPALKSIGTSITTISAYNAGTTNYVPDAIYGPTPTGVETGSTSETLSLTDAGYVSALNSFSFDGLQEDALGDFTAVLSHDGISVTIFDQTDSADFGGLAALTSDQAYTFADSGTDLGATAENIVNGAPTDVTVFPVGGDTYKSLGLLSAFDGTALAGDWTLTMTDNAVGNYGSFLGFSFNATTSPVPEASTWVGMALGCLALSLVAVKRRRTAASVASTL